MLMKISGPTERLRQMGLWAAIILTVVLLAGCGSHRLVPAPVSDVGRAVKTPAAAPVVPVTYQVQPGETLYSIAWRYSLTVQAIQALNQLPDEAKIRVGQVLKLRAVGAVSGAVRARPVPKKAKQMDLNDAEPVVVSAPKPEEKPPCCLKKEAKKTAQLDLVEAPAKKLSWQWPLSGVVVGRYLGNGGLNKGIDIQSKLGEPVTSAQEGVVVYAGNGLKDYGNLIIVKHGQHYLSAYGNNQQLWVQEGEKVSAGQKIASVMAGQTLHFEIRYQGQPVDPLRLLPAR